MGRPLVLFSQFSRVTVRANISDETWAPVAQRIEHLPSKQRAAGSSPAGSTISEISVLACRNHAVVVNKRLIAILSPLFVAAIVQLVRTPDCGSGGRGFKSH